MNQNFTFTKFSRLALVKVNSPVNQMKQKPTHNNTAPLWGPPGGAEMFATKALTVLSENEWMDNRWKQQRNLSDQICVYKCFETHCR